MLGAPQHARDVARPCLPARAVSTASSCGRCPEWVRCEGVDTTLATMQLVPGWWRVSRRSAELHWCGDAPGRVRVHLMEWREGRRNAEVPGPNSTSASEAKQALRATRICRGGVFPESDDPDGSCEGRRGGPLCLGCKNGTFLEDHVCIDCPDPLSMGGTITLLLALGLTAALSLRALHAYSTWRPKFSCLRQPSKYARAQWMLKAVNSFLFATSLLLRRVVLFFRNGSSRGLDTPVDVELY